MRVKLVFLVGFMGVGKTTIGNLVAERMGVPFFDLDERVERRSGSTIQEIFEIEGEKAFRDTETEELRHLVDSEPRGVVATGGGAFTVEENRRLMRDAGLTVWLDVPVDVLLERVDGATRPLWDRPDAIRALAERRKQYYRLADLRLELGSDSAERGAARLLQLVSSQCD